MDAGAIIFWFMLAALVAVLASKRNRNAGGWFFLALILSPLIAGILLLIIGEPEEQLSKAAKSVAHEAEVDLIKQRIAANAGEREWPERTAKQELSTEVDELQKQVIDLQRQIIDMKGTKSAEEFV